MLLFAPDGVRLCVNLVYALCCVADWLLNDDTFKRFAVLVLLGTWEEAPDRLVPR